LLDKLQRAIKKFIKYCINGLDSSSIPVRDRNGKLIGYMVHSMNGMHGVIINSSKKDNNNQH